MVSDKTYTVSKEGNVAVSLPTNTTYKLVDEKTEEKINKKILNTIVPKKTTATVTKGKSLSFALSSKSNKNNIKSITYTTTDKSTATGNKNGKISSKTKGTAIIKATITIKNGSVKVIKMKVKIK